MKRQHLPVSIRNRVLGRDAHTCQKCQRHTGEMHIHHIRPVRDGGSDDLANLITLCMPCHFEWEGVSEAIRITFADWLAVPPAAYLIAWVMDPTRWPDKRGPNELTPADVREQFLKSTALLMEFHRFQDEDDDILA